MPESLAAEPPTRRDPELLTNEEWMKMCRNVKAETISQRKRHGNALDLIEAVLNQ